MRLLRISGLSLRISFENAAMRETTVIVLNTETTGFIECIQQLLKMPLIAPSRSASCFFRACVFFLSNTFVIKVYIWSIPLHGVLLQPLPAYGNTWGGHHLFKCFPKMQVRPSQCDYVYPVVSTTSGSPPRLPLQSSSGKTTSSLYELNGTQT